MRWARALVPLIMLAVGLWAAGGAVHAQDEAGCPEGEVCIKPPRADWPGRGDGVQLHVGDPVTITLEVFHPDTKQIIFGKIDNQWGDVFERENPRQVSTQEKDERLVTTQTFEVVAFKPGEHETPPLIVTILSTGEPPLDWPAGTLKLNIVPVLGGDDEDLKPIKPPVDVPGRLPNPGAPRNWPWIVAGLAAIGLAAWGLHVLLKPQPPEPVSINHYRAALAELERIEGLQLPAAGRFKEHYTLVADVIRTYLEGEFGIPALDRTTSEIQAEVSGADIDADGAVEMRWLFVDCDIVKFTGLEPDEYEAGLMVGRAREILDMIRPPETPTEPEGGGQLAEAAGA